jgi:hypothetical protein
MRLSSAIRAMLIAWTLTVGFGTAAYADGGRIRFNVVKAGFVIGASGGSGTLLFHGRYYPLAIGGLSYGFTFGASATDFFGTVSNIRWCLCRSRRRRRDRSWWGRDPADQPERRVAHRVGPPSRTDRCR